MRFRDKTERFRGLRCILIPINNPDFLYLIDTKLKEVYCLELIGIFMKLKIYESYSQ